MTNPGNGNSFDYDYVIIGSGFGGSVSALRAPAPHYLNRAKAVLSGLDATQLSHRVIARLNTTPLSGQRPRYCIDAMEDRSFMSSACLCVSVLEKMLLSCARTVSSLTPSTSAACLAVSPAYTRCVTRASATVNP